MGVELMVSVWPTVDTRSETYREMADNGYLVTPDRGLPIHMNWMGECSFFDAPHPGARALIWKKAKENYYRHGVRVFWLDEAEPEYGKYDFDIQRYHLGPALTVGNLYPALYAKAFYDGMTAEGQTDVLNLVRCAWAGSQRYGRAGLVRRRGFVLPAPCGSSWRRGFPWRWRAFRGEQRPGRLQRRKNRRSRLPRAAGALVRVGRVYARHAHARRPPALRAAQGGIPRRRAAIRQRRAQRVWSFGVEMQALLSRYIRLREAMRPYLRRVAADTHATGAPMMRPLFYDFPVDPAAWREETAYMLGADLLVAPVLEPGVSEREVYLPAGETGGEQATGKRYEGGARVTAFAPLGVIPVFAREGSGLDLKAFFQ